MIEYKVIDKKYKKQVLDIATECFYTDIYFDYLGKGEIDKNF